MHLAENGGLGEISSFCQLSNRVAKIGRSSAIMITNHKVSEASPGLPGVQPIGESPFFRRSELAAASQKPQR
jgi:hypothetical protein